MNKHAGRAGGAGHWQEGRWICRDGLHLFYRDYSGSADRPPLVCLHGLTRNSRDFDGFAQRYASRFRIIAPDFRGRGLSNPDPLPARYLPPTYASDVIELLDRLRIKQAVFVGTSLGGLVTMLVAGIRPDLIQAAILNDVGPVLEQGGLERIRTYVGKPMRFGSWDEAADYVADINGRMPASKSHTDWIEAARRLCTEADGDIVFSYDMAIAIPFNQPGGDDIVDMWPLFRELGKKPLLIIRGANSDLLSAEAAEEMLRAAPGSELVTVPHVGHAPELTEPAAVSGVDAFLATAIGPGQT